jgi:hypothetical protein
MKPGDLVRYTYYYTRPFSKANSMGILLGPCTPPSMWYKVIMPWGVMDCAPHSLEVISEAR